MKTLGKSIRRVMIENLVKRVGLKIQTLPNLRPRHSEDTEAAVNMFNLSNEVSWQAPGRKTV